MSSILKEADKNGNVYGTGKKLNLSNGVSYGGKSYTSRTEALGAIQADRKNG